jgi:ribosomal protein S18 acetylase RimI-like enzyme
MKGGGTEVIKAVARQAFGGAIYLESTGYSIGFYEKLGFEHVKLELIKELDEDNCFPMLLAQSKIQELLF